jgi:hypothetical protein
VGSSAGLFPSSGLGLTGVITWAEVRLKPVPGSCLLTEAVPFDTLSRFTELTAESDKEWEYTVAWIDAGEFDALLVAQGVLGEHDTDPARPRRFCIPT